MRMQPLRRLTERSCALSRRYFASRSPRETTSRGRNSRHEVLLSPKCFTSNSLSLSFSSSSMACLRWRNSPSCRRAAGGCRRWSIARSSAPRRALRLAEDPGKFLSTRADRHHAGRRPLRRVFRRDAWLSAGSARLAELGHSGQLRRAARRRPCGGRDHLCLADRRRTGAEADRAAPAGADRRTCRAGDDDPGARSPRRWSGCSMHRAARCCGCWASVRRTRIDVTDEEIHILVAEAESAGVIEPGERAMISGVMRLGDRPVRGVMTPRREVEMIDLSRRRRRHPQGDPRQRSLAPAGARGRAG